MANVKTVNVLATGSVAELKLSKGQQSTVAAALQSIATASFSFHKSNDPKWEPVVRTIERNGIVIVSLQRQVAKMVAASFIAAWCDGLKKKELTAQEERQAKASASAAFSRAVKTYRKTPKESAAPADSDKDDDKDDSKKPTVPGNVVDIRAIADLESVLKLAHTTREMMVAFQQRQVALKMPDEMIESAGRVAIETGNIADGIRRVLDMLSPQPTK